ncbi:hypothetical protein [uncultured Agrococcus sp.]|uniref:hypothetical protein n=1 Tax=uncultured Agrococcus sp. TaxID=382258 RepID=UPI0025FB9D1F|nr:hypothetical protein [uncultured Agrococcus sp.]
MRDAYISIAQGLRAFFRILPRGFTITAAVLTIVSVACFGLSRRAEATNDESPFYVAPLTQLGGLALLVAACFWLAVAVQIQTRTRSWQSDRPWIDVLAWMLPLLAGGASFFLLHTLIGLAPEWDNNRRAETWALFFSLLALCVFCVGFGVMTIRGWFIHLGRVRRRRGWLPQRERLALDEQNRWERAWRSSQEAATSLLSRRVPQTLSLNDIMLRPEELAFLRAPLNYARHYATDVSYVHTSGFYFGSPLFVAAGLIGQSVANSHAKAQAARESQLQWREWQVASVVLTNERLLIRVNSQWLTFDHAAVISFHPEPSRWYIVIEYEGTSPLMLSGIGVPHLSVVMASILRGPDYLQSNPAFEPLLTERPSKTGRTVEDPSRIEPRQT